MPTLFLIGVTYATFSLEDWEAPAVDLLCRGGR